MDRIFEEGAFIPLMLVGIFIMLAFALAFVAFVSYSQKKILREKMRNQEQVNRHQEQLLHSNILTQEEERKRIARDLHDAIGSKLNVILLNVHRLKDSTKESKELTSITDEVEAVIHTTIDSTRRISHELLPPTLEEFGLVEAIREFQFEVDNPGAMKFNLTVNDHLPTIEDKILELNLFRVLQELFSNSIRHGKASEISLNLALKANDLIMIYTDNGVGFDMENAQNRKGLGMQNIESRLAMIHAESDYHSTPENGFKMSISLDMSLQKEASDEKY